MHELVLCSFFVARASRPWHLRTRARRPCYKLTGRQRAGDVAIKWIIFINPPFATSQKAGYSGESKQSVSDTKIRPLMHKADLGEVSREFVQVRPPT